MKVKENIIWSGIDISKKELEIHTYEKDLHLPSTLPNTKAGIKKLISNIKQNANCHFVFEATGGYEKLLLITLQNKGIKASRINPSLARNFAKAQGILSKTDAIDAKVLTDYARTLCPPPTPAVEPILEEMHALIKYRHHLGQELLVKKCSLNT